MKRFGKTENPGKNFSGIFPEVSAGQWKLNIEKELRGGDYEKLVWKPGDGISVNPFYCEEDTGDLSLSPAPAPGRFPFTRAEAEWKVCEDIPPVSATRAANLARDAEKGGADWIMFRGAKIKTRSDLSKLLSKTDLSKTGVCFDDRCGGAAQLKLFAEFAEKSGAEKPQGFFLCDPVGCGGGKSEIKRLARLLPRFEKSLPEYGLIGVCGSNFHNSGATPVEEAAFSLALGAEYLFMLGNLGVPVGAAAKAIVFHFSVGSLFFVEIAKLRAVRAVWAHIVERFDKSAGGKMKIHASSSMVNKPVCDPEVNILRATGEAMAAISGGCDSLSITAFDGRFQTSAKSQTVARNTQLILKEECKLDRVADPCAGSYYTDTMTDKFADAALSFFLEIEKRGGFLKCLSEGFIAERLERSARERAERIAAGRETLIGVNKYPIENERLSERLKTEKPGGAARDFERIRAETEKHARESGKALSVFLVQTGDPAMRSARAVFVRNFFAAAGFEIRDGGVFNTPARGAARAAESGADIFVLCSENAAYPSFSPPFMRALKKRIKNPVVVIAGKLDEESGRKCSEAGVFEFVHAGSNILKTLKKMQKAAGAGKRDGRAK